MLEPWCQVGEVRGGNGCSVRRNTRVRGCTRANCFPLKKSRT